MNIIAIFEIVYFSLFMLVSLSYYFGVRVVYDYINKKDPSFWDYALVTAAFINGIFAGMGVICFITGWTMEDPKDNALIFVAALHVFTLFLGSVAFGLQLLFKIAVFFGDIHERIIKKRGL